MLIFLLVIFFVSVSLADENVQYVAVIYRHGDRTPVSLYPTDPWRNESLWPVKFGELTNVGKRQHYALGQWFRKRYSRIIIHWCKVRRPRFKHDRYYDTQRNSTFARYARNKWYRYAKKQEYDSRRRSMFCIAKHLLSDEFDPTELRIRSTDVDRTLMSAQANLAGMYPPSGHSIWNPDLMWQPIPVHTVPEHQDEVLAMKKNCIAYNKEMKRYVHSKPYRDRLSKYQSLMDYLTAYTGQKIKDYFDIEDIYSNLYIETLYNFTLPNWTQSVYPDKLREPAGYSFATSAATPLLARLRGGPLIKEIVSTMVQSMSNQTKLKFSMYSGHDFTIGTVLTALGLFDGNCPVYTSTIIIELIHDNSTNAHFVRISYRNSTEIVEPSVLFIPYCGKKCPIERFIKLYDNLITVDFDNECGKQFPALLGISLLFGLCIFATIYVSHKIHFARVFGQNRNNVGYSNVQTTYLQTDNALIKV